MLLFCFPAEFTMSIRCLLGYVYVVTNILFAELYTKRMFELLLSAYSTISIQDTAVFLGMKEDDAANCKLLYLLNLLYSFENMVFKFD